MASIGEIVGDIQATIGKINEAVSAAGSAESGSDELQNALASLGVEGRAAQVNLVREAVHQLRQRLQESIDQATECITMAKAASD